MGDTEGIDYTMKEYMKLVAKTQACVDRLNEQGGSWTPHKVELAVWTHYVARDTKPEILADMPSKHVPKVDRFPSTIETPASNGETHELNNGAGLHYETESSPAEAPLAAKRPLEQEANQQEAKRVREDGDGEQQQRGEDEDEVEHHGEQQQQQQQQVVPSPQLPIHTGGD